jgi:hypothetical protein
MKIRGLELYSKAKAALAAAVRVDEVKEIRNQAIAMAAHARVADDRKLEADARELRERAEQRLGDMMEKQPKAPAGRPSKKIGVSKTPISKPATLAEAGIDKNLANRARKLASMSPVAFAQHIDDVRDRIINPGPRRNRRNYVTVMVERKSTTYEVPMSP